MFDLDQTTGSFIREQIGRVKEMYQLTNTELAEICGYERSAFHRMLISNSSISLKPLYRLSIHFGFSMDFWFPPREGNEVQPRPVPQAVTFQEKAIPTMLPITRKMIKAFNRVSVSDKRQLILLALRYPKLISVVFKLAELLEKVELSRRTNIVAVIEKIVKMK
jgi:plasmid maintenance system antidote protein VapI